MKFTVGWEKSGKSFGVGVSNITGKPTSKDMEELEFVVLMILKANAIKLNIELAEILGKNDFNELKARYDIAKKYMEEVENA